MKKKFTMLFAALLACVGVAKAQTTLPEMSEGDNIKWYTIKNTRSGKYVNYGGSGVRMVQTAAVSETSLFYFTASNAETAEGFTTVNIHNAVNAKLLANFTSWNEEGEAWYLSAADENGNLYITNAAASNDTDFNAWNDLNQSEVTNYFAKDAGSVWAIEKYEGTPEDFKDAKFLEFSTNENKVFYHIKNRRSGKYVGYRNGSSFVQTPSADIASYWYFVDASAELPEGTVVPEGYVACRIYNAASDLAVENPAKGVVAPNSGVQYPAKIYYIHKFENTYYGLVIYEYNDTNIGWNDLNQSGIANHTYDDAGSIWTLETVSKTEDDLKNEAVAAVNNAKALADACEYADYYSYSDEAVATFKAAVKDLDVTTDAVTAISSGVVANVALSALQGTEKSGAPAAGDVIQLKNKNYGTYLKPNGEKLNGTNDKDDVTTLWAVEAGDGTNVKLKNLSTGKYIGEIRKSADVAMVDAENAKQFAWTNQKDAYAVFKETTGGGYAYGHIAGHNVLVGWEASADATQWLVAQQTAEESLSTLVAVLEESKATYGENVGQYAQTEALTAAQDAAQALIDAESTDILVILSATQELQTEVAAKATLNLPVANKYYNIISSCTKDHRAGQQVYVNNGGGMQFAKVGQVASSISRVFQFVPATDGKFYIYNVERGVYMESVGTATTTDVTGAKAVTIANMGKDNIVKIVPDGQSMMHAQDAGSKIVGWNENAVNDGSAWTIEEVSIEDKAHAVTISDVQWSTLVLGYNAVIPEGVTAYAVASTNATSATLTEVEGTIPANEAVLLNGVAGTYEFKLAESAEVVEAVEGNLLKGSTVNTYVAEDAYVLAAKDGVGLYKATRNQQENTFLNNAFKAYLVVEGANAPMFSLERGEGTTSIEQVAADAELVIYDLAGRRVEKMEKGIYIVNGKKVVK